MTKRVLAIMTAHPMSMPGVICLSRINAPQPIKNTGMMKVMVVQRLDPMSASKR